MNSDLLPPNANPFERALSAAVARIGDVPTPIAALWNADTCPLALLPWLAWALSVDEWDPAWPEAIKRQRLRESIPMHRRKGTAAVVRAAAIGRDVIAGEGPETGKPSTSILEWWQQTPPAQPHTFQVVVPITAGSGPRTTVAYVDQVSADVGRVKPVRSHFRVVQRVPIDGGGALITRVRFGGYRRLEITSDTAEPASFWRLTLQTEDGEPFETEDGDLLFEEAA